MTEERKRQLREMALWSRRKRDSLIGVHSRRVYRQYLSMLNTAIREVLEMEADMPTYEDAE